MKIIKLIILGMILGLLVGLWCGVNIGKGKSIFSNPFEDKSLKERVLESSGEMLEKGGKALKESVNK